MRRSVALAVALAALAAPRAGAQEACDQYVKAPEVGGWGEYRVLRNNQPDGTTMRFAIVGSEKRDDEEMQWFEMITTNGDDETTIMKALVPGYPYDPAGVEELIMKTGDKPAMKMGGPMMMMMKANLSKNAGLQVAEECKRMQYVGEESVTVPAGIFRARHYKDEIRGAEVWIATNVPFGMVKATDGRDFGMELASHGDDAKSAITETPQDPFGGR